LALDKKDFQQIKQIVGESEKRLTNKIETAVDSLAVITKRGFDAVDKRFERLEKGQQQIRKDISNLEFIATEMVRRDEFIELKNRITKIEAKVGLSK